MSPYHYETCQTHPNQFAAHRHDDRRARDRGLSRRQCEKRGGFAEGATLSRENEWGIASEAIEKASENVVEAFARHKGLKKLVASGAMGGSEGKIIKVEGNRAWINMGSASGIQVGDRYVVLSVGEALIDPDTGQVLGVDESETGEGEVVDVKDRFAIMTFTGTANAKDVVRKR